MQGGKMIASFAKNCCYLLNSISECEMYFINVQSKMIPGKLFKHIGNSFKMIFNPVKLIAHPGFRNEKCYII